MRSPQLWRKDGHFMGLEAWMRSRGQYVCQNPWLLLQNSVWCLNSPLSVQAPFILPKRPPITIQGTPLVNRSPLNRDGGSLREDKGCLDTQRAGNPVLLCLL